MTTKEKLEALLAQGVRLERIAADLDIGLSTLVQWRKGKAQRPIFQKAFDAYYERTAIPETTETE